MIQRKRILIVGAGSCLAKAISERFSEKYYLVGCYHSTKPMENYFSQIFKTDLLGVDFVRLKKEMRLADEIIFCVGSYLSSFSNEYIFDSNYVSVKNFVDLYTFLGLSTRVIYFSSISVYSSSENIIITEKTKKMAKSPYGVGKIMGEDYLEKNGVNYVIMRPAMIFGKNFSKTFIELKKTLLKGKLFVYGKGNNWCKYCYETDLIDVVGKILMSKASYIDFNIVNEPIKQLDFMKELAKNFGIKKVLFISKDLALSDSKHPFNSTHIERFSRNQFVDCKKVKRVLKVKLKNNLLLALKETFS